MTANIQFIIYQILNFLKKNKACFCNPENKKNRGVFSNGNLIVYIRMTPKENETRIMWISYWCLNRLFYKF